MGIGDGTEMSSELRAPVRRYVVRNAKGDKVLRRAVMSLAAPSMDFSTMGQPKYRSTITIIIICVSLVVEKICT